MRANVPESVKFTWYQGIFSNRAHEVDTVRLKMLPDYIARKIGTKQRKDKIDLPLFANSVFKNGIRTERNVREIHAVVCEHDAGTMTAEQAYELLNGASLVFVLYTSPSHSNDHPKWRVILPLAEPIVLKDGRSTQKVKKQYRLLQARVNGVLKGVLAPESKDLVRTWFIGYIKGKDTPEIYSCDQWNGTFRPVDVADDLDKGAKPVGESSKIHGGGEAFKRVDDLTLETELEFVGGERKLLRDVLLDLEKRQGLRLSGKTYRQDSSGSDSVFMRLTDEGYPMAHDSATGVSHMLVQFCRNEVDEILGRPTSLSVTAGSGIAGQKTKAYVMSYPDMKDNLVQLTTSGDITFLNNTNVVLPANRMGQILAGNMTPNTNGDLVDTFSKWRLSLNRQQVETLTFFPGTSLFTTNPKGGSALNTWRPIVRPEMDYQSAVAASQMFWDHLEFLFKDRVDDFVNWLAHIEQNPGQLPHLSWLHISPSEGMGRSTMGNILFRVWNPYVAPDVDLAKLLDSSFNEVIASKLLAIVGEVKEGGKGQWNHRQKFKALITEEERTINRKFQSAYLEFNCLRWLMFSNHKNALPLDNADRRVEVVINEGKPKPQTYYQLLNRHRENMDFIHAVGCVLKNRNIEGYDPCSPAVLSEDKMTLIETTRNPAEAMVENIVEHWPYDVITAGALFGALTGEYSAKNPPSESRQMGHYVGDFKKLKKAKASVADRNGGVRRKTVCLYIVRNADKYDGLPAGVIVRQMEQEAIQRYDLFFKRGPGYDALSAGGKESLEEEFLGWKKTDNHYDYFPADRYFGAKFNHYWTD